MKKTSLEQLMEEVRNDKNSFQFCVRHLGGISEAEFSEDENKDKLVKVTVIKKGWSKNGVYYTQESLGQIQEFITTSARKVYVDHNPEGVKGSRWLGEWVADVMEAEVVEDELKATIKVHTDNPSISWIHERMKSSPDMFGPSIVGLATLKEGEAEGKKGKIVDDVKYIRSFDLVSEPAAGGKVDSVIESMFWNDDEELNIQEGKLSDHVAKIKERERRYKLREEFWMHERAFSDMMTELVFAEGDAVHHAIDERKKKVVEGCADFATIIETMEFIPPKPESTKEEETSEGVDTEEITNNIDPNKSNKEQEVKNLKEFREQYPELAEAFKVEITEAFTSTSKETELTEEVTNLKTKITTLDEDKVKLADANKTLTEQVAVFEAKDLAVTKKELIEGVVKEAKLEEHLVTEVFESTLDAVSFDPEKVDEFKESISALCEDRKGIVKPKNKIDTGNDDKTDDEETITEGIDNKAALLMLKKK